MEKTEHVPLRRSGAHCHARNASLHVDPHPRCGLVRPRHVPRFGQSKNRRKEHQHLTPKISVSAARLPISRPRCGEFIINAQFGSLNLPPATTAAAGIADAAGTTLVFQSETAPTGVYWAEVLNTFAQSTTMSDVSQDDRWQTCGDLSTWLCLMCDEGREPGSPGMAGWGAETKQHRAPHARSLFGFLDLFPSQSHQVSGGNFISTAISVVPPLN